MKTECPQEPLLDSEVGPQSKMSDVLRVLDEVNVEAEENALPLPSDQVHRNARFLIPRLLPLWSGHFVVYPLFDGEIAIEATVASRHSILVSCEADGSILCLVNIRQQSRRARYETVASLPDRFFRDAFSELNEVEV